jgi:hypothetical protein
MGSFDIDAEAVRDENSDCVAGIFYDRGPFEKESTMQNYLKVFLILGMVVGIGACKGGCQKGDEAEAPGAKEAAPTEDGAPSEALGKAELAPEQIADALSKSVCARMVACNTDAGITEADCAAGMTKDLAQALPDKAKVVSQSGLDGCIAAITKASCEDLKAPSPPKGCEFME